MSELVQIPAYIISLLHSTYPNVSNVASCGPKVRRLIIPLRIFHAETTDHKYLILSHSSNYTHPTLRYIIPSSHIATHTEAAKFYSSVEKGEHKPYFIIFVRFCSA